MSASTMKMREWLVLSLSSCFGLGYAPKAPGTVGTLGGLVLWWMMAGLSLERFVIATIFAIGVAIWVCREADRIYGSHDSGKIVIDEVVGLLCAVMGIPFELPWVLGAFCLFRFFDVLKPPPIRQIDRHVDGGLGIVLDDVVAGLVVCGILNLAKWFAEGRL